MGNVNGREDGAGPSGVKHEEGEQYMESAHGGAHVSYHAHGLSPESMVQSPPHSPRSSKSPLMFTPQVPMVPLQRPDETMQIQSHARMQNTTEFEDMHCEQGIPTMITWSYGGNEVVVSGSWDNWKTKKPLQRSGKDFTIMKVLPSGVYHYRFIVDGRWMCAPDLPLVHDDMGNAYNILDLQDYIPEDLESITGFESPPSPKSSYNNELGDDFFGKVPDVPPQLQMTLLSAPSPSMDIPQSLSRPSHAVLNHLYIQKGGSDQSVVALGSTHRFRTKYVTVVLYKSLQR